MLVLNRMSKKLKSVTKKLFGGKSQAGMADTLFKGSSSGSSRRDEILKHIDPALVGRTVCFERDQVIFTFVVQFCNMNLFIDFHIILQDQESSEREDSSEATDQVAVEEEAVEEHQEAVEEDQVQQETSEEGEGQQDASEQEGVGGDGSALGSGTTRRFRSSHLVSPPVAPHGDSRIVITPCGDG